MDAVKMAQYLVHVAHTIDIQFIHHSSLTHVSFRHNQAFVAQLTRLDGDRKRATDGQDGTVQTQFAHHHVAVEQTGGNHILCGQNADGHREVVGSTFLSDVGGCQVDGNLLCGKFVSAVVDSSHNAFMTLAYGVVGKTHQSKTRSSGRVHFDGNRRGLHAFHSCAIQFYKHISLVCGSMSSVQLVPVAMILRSLSIRIKKGSSFMPHSCTRGLFQLRKSQ